MTRERKGGLHGLIIEILGWILVFAGLAALVLPGPGLLALFAGVALLANRYEWAERRLEPVKVAAIKTARDSVSDWPHIIMSVIGVLLLVSAGVLWGLQPAVPGWWPLADRFWLPGGWVTGGTMIGSAVLASAMIVYSYINFRD
jgi:hypothetical protein